MVLITQTDETGNAVFTDLIPGDYLFSVSKDEYISANGSVTISDSDKEITVIINKIPEISGQIVYGEYDVIFGDNNLIYE